MNGDRPKVSVIIATHNPDFARLQTVLLGLRAQTLASHEWETVLVDNGSTRWPDAEYFNRCAPENLSVVHEAELGLSVARRRGFAGARADIAVLVDDDNVLAPDYLAEACNLLVTHPRVGVAGGKSIPSFVAEPPKWMHEFFPLLALRDLGESELISAGLQPPNATQNQYPTFAPMGAGMVVRRAAWTSWVAGGVAAGSPITDRRGTELCSGGDNEIVLCAMQEGWESAYFPRLQLAHLIPSSRLQASYLARLNRAIQESWIQVLAMHDACPWPPLTRTGAALRKFKALLAHRPWSSDAAHIRWQGSCGHFDGRVTMNLHRRSRFN